MNTVVAFFLVFCFAWALIASTAAAEWKAAYETEADRADRAEEHLADLRQVRRG